MAEDADLGLAMAWSSAWLVGAFAPRGSRDASDANRENTLGAR